MTKVYSAYHGTAGKAKLRDVLRGILGSERQKAIRARAEIEASIEAVDDGIRTLVDNISKVNRAMIDARLSEIGVERRLHEQQLEQLRFIEISTVPLDGATSDCRVFLEQLTDLLNVDNPAIERQASIRRCIKGVVIDREHGTARFEVRCVPSCGMLPEELPTTIIETPIHIKR